MAVTAASETCLFDRVFFMGLQSSQMSAAMFPENSTPKKTKTTVTNSNKFFEKKIRCTYQTRPQDVVLIEKKVKILIKEQHGWTNKSTVEVIQFVLRHVRHLRTKNSRFSFKSLFFSLRDFAQTLTTSLLVTLADTIPKASMYNAGLFSYS